MHYICVFLYCSEIPCLFDHFDCSGIPCTVFVLSVKTVFIDLTCAWVQLGESSLRCIDPPNPSRLDFVLYNHVWCYCVVFNCFFTCKAKNKHTKNTTGHCFLPTQPFTSNICFCLFFVFVLNIYFCLAVFVDLQAVQKFNWTHHTSRDTWNCTKEKTTTTISDFVE